MDREKLFRYLDQRYCSKRELISRIPLGVQPDALWQELLNRRLYRSTSLTLYSSNGMPYWCGVCYSIHAKTLEKPKFFSIQKSIFTSKTLSSDGVFVLFRKNRRENSKWKTHIFAAAFMKKLPTGVVRDCFWPTSPG